jgi:hypothetical protein
MWKPIETAPRDGTVILTNVGLVKWATGTRKTSVHTRRLVLIRIVNIRYGILSMQMATLFKRRLR